MREKKDEQKLVLPSHILNFLPNRTSKKACSTNSVLFRKPPEIRQPLCLSCHQGRPPGTLWLGLRQRHPAQGPGDKKNNRDKNIKCSNVQITNVALCPEKLYIWEYTSGRKNWSQGYCEQTAFSSLAAWKSESLRLFWLHSQLLNLEEKPGEHFFD